MYVFVALFASVLGCAHGGQVDASYHAVVLDIKDGLRQILPAGDREIAINALLRGAETAEAINPYVNQTLGQVLDLLAELWQFTMNQLQEYERWVQTITHEAEFCDEMDRSALIAAEAIVEEKADIHIACRTTHETVWHQLNNSQTAVITFMNTGIHDSTGGNMLSTVCVKPSIDDSIENWNNRLTAAEDWVEAAETEWQSLTYDYATLTTAESSNRTQCNADQQVFETAVCQFIADYKVACEARAHCWETRVQNSTTIEIMRQIQSHNIHVREMLRMIDYISCLVGLMRVERAAEAKTECADILNRDLGEHYPDLEVNITTIPVEDDCNGGRLNASANWFPFPTYYPKNFSSFAINTLLAPSAICPVLP